MQKLHVVGQLELREPTRVTRVGNAKQNKLLFNFRKLIFSFR